MNWITSKSGWLSTKVRTLAVAALAVGLGTLATASTASAATILLQDGFETYNEQNKTFPTGSGTWATTDTGPDFFSIVTSPKHDGAKSLKVGDSSNAMRIYRQFDRQTSGILTATVWLSNSAVAATGLGFALTDGATFTNSAASISLGKKDNLDKANYGSGKTVISGFTYAANTFNEYTVVVNLDSKKYDVLINGTQYVTGAAFDSAVTGVDTIFVGAGTKVTGWADDVQVSIPEPASVGLLSLGGLMLLARKR